KVSDSFRVAALMKRAIPLVLQSNLHHGFTRDPIAARGAITFVAQSGSQFYIARYTTLPQLVNSFDHLFVTADVSITENWRACEQDRVVARDPNNPSFHSIGRQAFHNHLRDQSAQQFFLLSCRYRSAVPERRQIFRQALKLRALLRRERRNRRALLMARILLLNLTQGRVFLSPSLSNSTRHEAITRIAGVVLSLRKTPLVLPPPKLILQVFSHARLFGRLLIQNRLKRVKLSRAERF